MARYLYEVVEGKRTPPQQAVFIQGVEERLKEAVQRVRVSSGRREAEPCMPLCKDNARLWCGSGCPSAFSLGLEVLERVGACGGRGGGRGEVVGPWVAPAGSDKCIVAACFASGGKPGAQPAWRGTKASEMAVLCWLALKGSRSARRSCGSGVLFLKLSLAVPYIA